MSESDNDRLYNEIKYLSKDLKMLYKIININLKNIDQCKKLISTENISDIDDFKFYDSLIDNSIDFYSESIKVRKSKLSKDIQKIFKLIGIDKYIEEDIFFSSEIITQGVNEYKKMLESKKNKNVNDHYWLNEISLKDCENWPDELKKLLLYHKYLIEYLVINSEIDLVFFKKKKDDNEITDYFKSRLANGVTTMTTKADLLRRINEMKTENSAFFNFNEKINDEDVEKSHKMEKLETDLANKNTKIQELNNKLNDKEIDLANKNTEIERLSKEIEDLVNRGNQTENK